MSTRSFTQPLRYVLAAVMLALSLVLLVNQSSSAVRAAITTAGNTYVVNSTADTVDADVGDPACADANGHCTLRAAIMQANFVTGLDTITLPSGVYVLTRSGIDDEDVLGDLDIADDLTIQGAGADATIIDGNGAVTGDRVFHVFRTPICVHFVNMYALTIRHGRALTTTITRGGGIYHVGCTLNEGSFLSLSDVVIEGNNAEEGGGLFVSEAVLSLTHSIIRSNTAAFNGGGVWGFNFVPSIRDSEVYSNSATLGDGGGLGFDGGRHLQSSLIQRSEVGGQRRASQ